MKSYLDLITISAKTHRRERRMTLLCIIVAVFLVTSVFGMADMMIRMERSHILQEYGNWHVMVKNVPSDVAKELERQENVSVVSPYDVANYHLDEEYRVEGKKAAICLTDEAFLTKIFDYISEGSFPDGKGEIMLSDNTRKSLSLHVGDRVTLETPAGKLEYTISGFSHIPAVYVSDAVFVVMDQEAWNTFSTLTGEEQNSAYYVQFRNGTNIRSSIDEIKARYALSDETLAENTPLLGVSMASRHSFVVWIYLIAGGLFVIVLMAGTLMITGTINSNVSQRTRFFGMLRCIGASKTQIQRYVRLEALHWCKVAVPIGILTGILATWILCAVLKYGVGGEFSEIPLFGISGISMSSGFSMGILSVLLASRSPAKRAASVSPVTAAAGNTDDGHVPQEIRAAGSFRIEILLGIRHARSDRKKLILLAGSFSLSIILFLSFSAFLDFAQHAAKPLKVYTPDLSISSEDFTCSIDPSLIEKIADTDGVKRVYGRMYREGIPVSDTRGVDRVNLISYDDQQMEWAERDVLRGDLSLLQSDACYAATVYDPENSFAVGDKIVTNGIECEIACVLSDSPFNSNTTPILLCSETVFRRLTGENGYSVIDIQLGEHATESTVNVIRDGIDGSFIFSDRREVNREDRAAYWAFRILAYGFLVMIAAITVFHIMNSVSMDVLARKRQYGIMRAVGMSGSQIKKMITAESFAYALSGSVAGVVLGIPAHWLIFVKMITSYWGDPWVFPILPFLVILFVVILSVGIAGYRPSRRITEQAVTEIINE